jgi:hypothetical protein
VRKGATRIETEQYFEIQFLNGRRNHPYSHGTYAQVLAKLAALIVGIPKVDTYEFVNSTFHKIAAAS